MFAVNSLFELQMLQVQPVDWGRPCPCAAHCSVRVFSAVFAMTTAKLRYRGVAYDASQHEHPSAQPVDHIYRGQHYEAPLKHEAAPADPELALHYRGHVYHHRAAEAARQVADS